MLDSSGHSGWQMLSSATRSAGKVACCNSVGGDMRDTITSLSFRGKIRQWHAQMRPGVLTDRPRLVLNKSLPGHRPVRLLR